MGNVTKISVALTPKLAALVHDAVETGEFASASEVIRDALRDWNGRRSRRAEAIEAMRRAWTEGINSGPSIDAEIVFAEIRAEMAALVAAAEQDVDAEAPTG